MVTDSRSLRCQLRPFGAGILCSPHRAV
jgi:hypothetical protein